jgi:hypothetical protein
VTGGEAHEVKGCDALMELHDINPDKLLGDKGYDSDDIRDDLAEPDAVCQSPQAVPPHRNPLRENRQSSSDTGR